MEVRGARESARHGASARAGQHERSAGGARGTQEDGVVVCRHRGGAAGQCVCGYRHDLNGDSGWPKRAPPSAMLHLRRFDCTPGSPVLRCPGEPSGWWRCLRGNARPRSGWQHARHTAARVRAQESGGGRGQLGAHGMPSGCLHTVNAGDGSKQKGCRRTCVRRVPRCGGWVFV
eukprot:1160179-Pelagomonas_calceolata.AAC.4